MIIVLTGVINLSLSIPFTFKHNKLDKPHNTTTANFIAIHVLDTSSRMVIIS